MPTPALFEKKIHGKLKLAFPVIDAIVGLGPIIAGMLGFLNPIISFFEIIVFIAKFALWLALLPLMLIAFLVDLLINAIKSVFDTLLKVIAQFKGIDESAGLSQYIFHGKVGHFHTAATEFFKNGVPGADATEEAKSKHVYGVFLVAVNTTSLSGIQQMFGIAPDLPAPGVTAPKINALGGDKDNKSVALSITSQFKKPDGDAWVAAKDYKTIGATVISGLDVYSLAKAGTSTNAPTGNATFTDAGGAPVWTHVRLAGKSGRIVGNWTNTVNTIASYKIQIQDMDLTPPPVPPATEGAPYFIDLGSNAATTAGQDAVPYKFIVVKQAGTHHAWYFDEPVTPLVLGHKYRLVVTLVDDAGVPIPPSDPKSLNPQASDPSAYAPVATMPPLPAPAPPGPLPVPASSEITFQGREGFNVALPGIGFLTGFLVTLEQPLLDFEKLITDTLGRFSIQKDAILAMIDTWTDQINKLHEGVTWLQNLVAKFAVFTVHFGGAMEVGTVWLFRYDGPVNGIGAAMAPILARGLEDGTGEAEQIIQCEFILGEDPVSQGLLKFLTDAF